ncbi:putative transcription factor C2H2 family [Medicago truncatula]|uniref:Putative transcription factor C2H2 family n=1 Tax=Medicago truncatula TaxID=3880 RepID=A0A072ULK8_MEDTR|nr:RING-H2 finger protein ATL39 [Medicago truncatula]KEH29943.1 zinc finger, C3HC4 type (RING finger) protein [Medicago truncatula]RHN60615.1 putative transcription factor C2H2 family [Medicago truncatula]
MEIYNRRLLLLNEDVPISTSISPFPQIQPNASSPSISITPPSKTFTPPLQLQLPSHPIFSSNIAYIFLLLFSTLFFLAFILLSFRELSFRRRRRYSLRQGLDSAAVKSLPMCEYKEDVKQPDCVICLEEFEVCEEVKMIPYCKHVFHAECIDTWLSAHVTCPICRCVIVVCGGGGNVDEHVGRSTVENEGDGEVG